MSLSARCAVTVSASLLLACGHAQPPAPLSPAAPSDDYVTIIPDVTYSPTGQDAALDAAPVSTDEDVMAGILAIPPGSRSRHATCSDCTTEAFHDSTR
jgi:hypothetical protein